ncbi:MAG: toprim domain-containing protein [Candidatus Xenobia bacterium]
MKLDFSALKRSVPITRVLAAYGIGTLQPLGTDRLMGPCPIHKGDNPTAFRIHLTQQVWHCFTRCGGGNVLDLVARLEHCDIYHAGLRLADLAYTESIMSTPPANSPTIHPRELQFRLTLAPHRYLQEERGLSRETCTRFGVGYCSHGLLAGTIAIPIHDHAGRLVAYAGRRLIQGAREGKYRFPRGFGKSHVLFNAWRVVPGPEELVVVEGFFDVFRLHQQGYPTVVALMGTTTSSSQLAWLTASGRPLVLLLDGDAAGRHGTASLAHLLGERGHPHRTIYLEEGVQPEHLTPTRLRALLGTAHTVGNPSL